MQSKQYFTKIKNYPHEKSTEPEICSPENSLLCVFGQANPAPTVNDLAGWFSFDTLPYLPGIIIPETYSESSTVY